jgi:hypothetical protein
MVQIDYEITISYSAIFPKNSLWGRYPRTPTIGGSNECFHPPRTPNDICGGGGGGIPPTPPIRKWDPSMTKTRPLNQEDNQAPHQKISHLETDHNNSTTVVHV